MFACNFTFLMNFILLVLILNISCIFGKKILMFLVDFFIVEKFMFQNTYIYVFDIGFEIEIHL